MAKGDLIAGIGEPDSLIVFQPAAGIEIMITAVGGNGNVSHSDGAKAAVLSTVALTVCKVGITNALYLQLSAGGTGLCRTYTGVQVK